MNDKAHSALISSSRITKKEISESCAKQQVRSSNNKKNISPTVEVVRCTTAILVKKNKHKGDPKMVSGGSGATKVMDEKRRATGNGESRASSWSRTLREQNPATKQVIQQLAEQLQSTENPKYSNCIGRERKSIRDTHKSPKYIAQNKVILDEIPVKQQAARNCCQHALMTVPSTTTIASSSGQYVEMSDVGVQCGFESNDKFGEFNPVATLEFLMKEMERLVRDEKCSKILTEMEQTLFKIPREYGKLSPAHEEAFDKLHASAAELQATSKKLEARCAELRGTNQSLVQQVHKHVASLNEAQQYRKDLENKIQQLNVALDDCQQRERSLEATVKKLTRERDEQMDAAQNNYMEVQYLQLQKEKVMTLSEYKNTRLVELEAALKGLQTHFSEELALIREAGERAKDDNNQQMSIIHSGVACSSPTSTTSSNNSQLATPRPNVSEMSLSSITTTTTSFSNSSAPKKKPTSSNSQLQSTCLTGLFEEDTDILRFQEKTQLEFFSLPGGGDSSRTISSSHHPNEEQLKISTCSDKKEQRSTSRDRTIEEFHSAPNIGDGETMTGQSMDRVERDVPCSKLTSRKSSSADKKQQRASSEKRLERSSSDNPASIEEQVKMMFQDVRRQTAKFPADVPSPPRNYPTPDWSDGSLPTISGISDVV